MISSSSITFKVNKKFININTQLIRF